MAPSSTAGPNRGRASAIGGAASDKATAPRMGMVHARMTASGLLRRLLQRTRPCKVPGALPLSARGRTKTPGVADAGRSHVNGFGADRLRRAQVARGLLAAFGHDVVADRLAFHERAHAGALDRADMHEHVLAAVGRLNESKTFLGIEELHGTCGHHGLLALYALANPTREHRVCGHPSFGGAS